MSLLTKISFTAAYDYEYENFTWTIFTRDNLPAVIKKKNAKETTVYLFSPVSYYI